MAEHTSPMFFIAASLTTATGPLGSGGFVPFGLEGFSEEQLYVSACSLVLIPLSLSNTVTMSHPGCGLGLG